MNVTVTTDASFYKTDKVGGFAYQIRSNKGLKKGWGPFKGKVTNPTEAEMKALITAIFTLRGLDYKIDTLTINTDCEFIVKHMFNDNEERKHIIRKLSDEISDALKTLDYKHLNIRHVKAHSTIDSRRKYVNDWCDKHCRQGSKIASAIKHGKRIRIPGISKGDLKNLAN